MRIRAFDGELLDFRELHLGSDILNLQGQRLPLHWPRPNPEARLRAQAQLNPTNWESKYILSWKSVRKQNHPPLLVIAAASDTNT